MCVVFVLFVHLATTAARANPRHCDAALGTCFVLEGNAVLISGGVAAAWGTVNDTIAINGWARLEVHTNETVSDAVQMFAAGFFEGAVTTQRTWESIFNQQGNSSGFSPALREYVTANVAWTRAMAAELGKVNEYWYHVGLTLTQWGGLYAGYVAADGPVVTQETFYAAQLMGEMEDLCVVFGCDDISPGRSRVDFSSDGHCSVLIKPLPDFSEIFIGHTTWARFETMTRLFKHYDFPLRRSASSRDIIAARHTTFSSYPACLTSTDDWYQLSSGLVVTETTIENNNATLWQHVQPASVPEWVRNMVANRLARSGTEWSSLFGKFNSGTYNNAFMVLDFNRFTAGAAPSSGFFVQLEQLPGLIVFADLTPQLVADSYFGSYNRPYFPEVFSLSNQSALEREFGAHYSWNGTARAVLFRQLHSSVTDALSFERVMRWNHFQTDAIATQGCTNGASASNAISERGDLTAANSGCFDDIAQQDEGGIDMKYTSTLWRDAAKGWWATRAQSGPTYDTQPAFMWSSSPFAATPHIGQPDLWRFPFVDFNYTQLWRTSPVQKARETFPPGWRAFHKEELASPYRRLVCLQTEFAVRMTCGRCVARVTDALRDQPGILHFDVALERQLVTVDATLATADLLSILTGWQDLKLHGKLTRNAETGLQVVVRGKGGVEPVDPARPHLGAVVAVMHPDGDTRTACGLVRLTQVAPTRVVIDGAIDGLAPGLHGLHIHEFGDLTAGCSSTGGHFNPTGATHGGPMDTRRHVGDLGNILANESGRAVFLLQDDQIKVWDIVGRVLVVDSEPDDLGHGGHALSAVTGNTLGPAGGVICGLLARSAGVQQNTKQVCACDGVSLWGDRIPS